MFFCDGLALVWIVFDWLIFFFFFSREAQIKMDLLQSSEVCWSLTFG